MNEPSFESDAWKKVTGLMGDHRGALGPRISAELRRDPKRLGFVLSRYKFAAKMARRGGTVVELGCGEGLGSRILSEFAAGYTGVDSDSSAVASAQRDWGNEKTRFLEGSLLDGTFGRFDALVCLDGLERVEARRRPDFADAVARNLADDGACVVGAPGGAADGLQGLLRAVFHNVFMFGMNDEVVHTGLVPAAHYSIALGCNKIRRGS